MYTPLYAQYTYARRMSVACADGPAKKQVSCAACNLAVEVSYCYDIHLCSCYHHHCCYWCLRVKDVSVCSCAYNA
jgi:hypothetical protein